MSKDLNSVTVIGRLVRDPEIKYTPNGTAIAKFSIANNESYIQNNEKKEYVSYFDINVWGNQAINCDKYLNKGNQVAIVGYLRQNRWTDKDGQKRNKIEITASLIQFLSKPSESTTGTIQNITNNNAGKDKDKDKTNNTGGYFDPWNETDGVAPDDTPF